MRRFFCNYKFDIKIKVVLSSEPVPVVISVEIRPAVAAAPVESAATTTTIIKISWRTGWTSFFSLFYYQWFFTK